MDYGKSAAPGWRSMRNENWREETNWPRSPVWPQEEGEISEVSEVSDPPSPFFTGVLNASSTAPQKAYARREGWKTTDFTDFTDQSGCY
jgi:hypothetical protein